MKILQSQSSATAPKKAGAVGGVMPTTRADAHLCGLSAPRLDLRSRGKLRCRPSYGRSGNHRVRSPGRGCCKVCYVGLHRCIHFRCRRNTTGVLSTGFMTSDVGSHRTPRWSKPDSNLYGAFPVKWLFWVLLRVLCSERESRSSSRRLRSGSRSARKGSRDRNASIAWRLAA